MEEWRRRTLVRSRNDIEHPVHFSAQWFSRCEELLKATKDAHLDVAALQQVYNQIESKGQALTAASSKSISAYVMIKETWVKTLDEATKVAR